MGKKLDSGMEYKILQLFNEEKKSITWIAKELRISRPTIYSVLKTYHVPMPEEKREKKEKENIIKILSLRLWYFCDDYKLLAKMFVSEVSLNGCKEVFVPKKMASIIPIDKIKKVVNIANIAGLNCQLQIA